MNRRFFAIIAASLGVATAGSLAELQAAVQVYQTTPATPSTATYVVPASTSPTTITPVAVPAQPTTVVVTETPPPPPPRDDDDDDAWGEFNIGGGVAMFQGDSGDYLDNSPSIDIGFYGPMGKAGQFGLEGGYVTGANLKGTLPGRLRPTIAGVPQTGPFTTDVKAHIIRGTPEFRFGPLIKSGSVKIMPYVVGGGGFYWTRYNDDNLNLSGGSSGLPSNNDYNGGWNAGAGLTVSVAPALGLGVDVRYHDIVYKGGPDTTYLLPEGKLVLYF